MASEKTPKIPPGVVLGTTDGRLVGSTADISAHKRIRAGRLTAIRTSYVADLIATEDETHIGLILLKIIDLLALELPAVLAQFTEQELRVIEGVQIHKAFNTRSDTPRQALLDDLTAYGKSYPAVAEKVAQLDDNDAWLLCAAVTLTDMMGSPFPGHFSEPGWQKRWHGTNPEDLGHTIKVVHKLDCEINANTDWTMEQIRQRRYELATAARKAQLERAAKRN